MNSFEWYVRFCRRCDRKYRTKMRHSKICGECEFGKNCNSAEKEMLEK